MARAMSADPAVGESINERNFTTTDGKVGKSCTAEMIVADRFLASL